MAMDFHDDSYPAKENLSVQTDFIRYSEDRMSEDEIKQFSARLGADRAMRIAFVKFMRQQVQMSELLSGSSSDGIFAKDRELSENSSVLSGNESRLDGISTATELSAGKVVNPLLQDVELPLHENFSLGSLWNGIAYSVFALIVLATFAGVWWSRANQTNNVVSDAKNESPSILPKVETTETQETQIASGNSDLQVDSNTIRVALPNVGYASIQTPAEFKMITPMLGRLTKGRINIHVTESAGSDFVLETPHGNIKNLAAQCDLNVDSDLGSGLLVRQGSVNLEIPSSENNGKWTFVKHIAQGEGITFSNTGEIKRVMSVVKAGPITYLTPEQILNDAKLVIRGVSDTLKSSDTNKFYEIIPSGFKEDAPSCVDREQAEWNGVDENGIPKYLIGADYIKIFGDDAKERNLEISVTIGRPAKLYVFYDETLTPPSWLKNDFRKTGDRVGADAGRYRYSTGGIRNDKLGVGPGVSIDSTYSVWEKIVEEPGVVTLGAIEPRKHKKRWISSIYGIAAVALESESKDIKDSAK